MKNLKFVSIGFGSLVNLDRVVAIVKSDTLPSRRLINDARDAGKLLDATCGRKTRAIVVVDSGQVILCGLNTDTIAARLNLQIEDKEMEDEEA